MTQEVLKLALEALEEAWYHVGTFQPTEKAIDLYDKARTAIKEALREHALREVQRLGQEIEQEPVAWMHIQGRHQELSHFPLDDGEISRGWEQYPLYTTPPQRTWVGLTDEDVNGFVGQYWGDEYMKMRSMVRAIEAKLNEKNT